MTNRPKLTGVALILFACVTGVVAENNDEEPPDTALLEFLGELPEESEDWELFIDLISNDLPPVMMKPEVAEVEFVETEND